MGSISFAQEAVSPFVPPSKARPTPAVTTTPATALDSIEFNGVIEIGGVVQISLYDPSTKKSYWLTEKEAGEDGFSLVNYDAGKIRGADRVLIRQGGVSKTLTLKDADIISLKTPPTF